MIVGSGRRGGGRGGRMAVVSSRLGQVPAYHAWLVRLWLILLFCIAWLAYGLGVPAWLSSRNYTIFPLRRVSRVTVQTRNSAGSAHHCLEEEAEFTNYTTSSFQFFARITFVWLHFPPKPGLSIAFFQPLSTSHRTLHATLSELSSYHFVMMNSSSSSRRSRQNKCSKVPWTVNTATKQWVLHRK